MARTPENENLSRETYQDERSQQQRAYQSAQTDIGQFNKNTDTLDKGGEVAADPFRENEVFQNGRTRAALRLGCQRNTR